MPAPILATKLHIPKPRPQLVVRPRLLDQLDAGLRQGAGFGRKLTLISAAAGCGKSTLASAWVANCGLPVAWLSLDAGDHDLTRFLAYLVAAVQTVAPHVGAGALAMLDAALPPPTEALLTTLLNDIASLPEGFVLVLDDYHTVDAQPVDQALAFLLQHQPPQLHLVIATREDPLLPLARLRVHNQLAEVRAADLRFTPAEAAEFLNGVMGLTLTAEEIAALEAHTEGWIAGLQLAALAMQGQPEPAHFVAAFSGSHHFVLDYLLEEVLHNLPDATQTFLLRTSILERLCGPLCDAVLGGEADAAGQATLETLERANLFLVSLDHERRWYRYHHLFGELLRQRLGTPADLAALHLRASHWHEKSGDLASAFHHAHAARDYVRAAQLAEMAWKGMDDTFQAAAWLGWVNRLPEPVIRARPLLCTQAAYALMDGGEIEASEARLHDAVRSLAPTPDPSLSAMIATARAYNAQVRGDLPATVQYAEAALELIPEDDLFRRAQATVILEMSHWASGDLEAAYRAMGAWMARMTELGNIEFVVASAFAAADMLIALGRLGDAMQTYHQALHLAAAQGKATEQITAHHHLGLAMLYREVGKDERATHHLQLAAELSTKTTLADWPHRWTLAQAELRAAEGEMAAALALLDEAKRLYVKTPVPKLRPVEAMQARIYLRQGQREKVQAWAAARGLALTDEGSYLREFELLTLARLHAAAPAVNDLLARLLHAAEAQQRIGSVVEILLTQALAYAAQGNRPQALASLAPALTLAEPEGYRRTFVDEGEEIRLLLLEFRAAHERKPDAAAHLHYVDSLLAAFAATASAPARPPANVSPSALVEPLSACELEVLRLVALGLSNGEISQRLFLALSSVKGHNLRTFAKLQVQNRTEAVARARELGLL